VRRGGDRRPAVGQREPSGGGAGVDEDRDVTGPLGHLGHRLEGGDLVVGRLTGHDGGVGEVEVVQTHPRLLVDRHDARRGARPARRVEHGGVLDGGVHERLSPVFRTPVQPEQTAVDRLGARRREDDLVGADAQRLRGGGPGVVQHEPCRAPGVVDPARVGPCRLEGGRVGLPGRGVQRLAGGGVEVDPLPCHEAT
jgi:hypothetical protein